MYTHNKYPRCYDSDALQKLTPMVAGQWPTQKPYKNCFLFQKECGWPYNFLPGGRQSQPDKLCVHCSS